LLVPDLPEKPGSVGGKEHEEENAADAERPTVNPPFDPVAFARQVHQRTTPPRGTEEQRFKAAARKKTPTSTLSLANARIPSNLPPPPAASSAKTPPQWRGLDVATQPPPADGPDQDPEIEIASERTPSLVDFNEAMSEFEADTVERAIPPELTAEVRETPKQILPPRRNTPRGRGAPTVRRKSSGSMKLDGGEMKDRMSLGDYSGALEIAEKILAADASNADARMCAEKCRGVLRQMYATRIGPLDRVPVVMVPRDQLRWLSIDHKAGFVLSLVDGVSSVEMIIDVSGMPELDTLRILSELTQQRIISLR
jgi:hypothetical protein